MKALFYEQYGGPEVLGFKDVEKPTPGKGEVLIKVYATTVNRTDSATIRPIPIIARLMTGLFRPKWNIPGSEFAGIVEGIGNEVQSLKVGDKVFGFLDFNSGSHAQYMTIREDHAITIPDHLPYTQAAANSEGAHYAYNFIKKINLEKGHEVLVYGGTGAIGSAAIQLLKYFGAQVTAVCDTKNMDLMKSIGAYRVIDYTKEDYTRDQQRYHFVFDTVGKISFFQCRHLLLKGGVYISSDLGFMAQNVFLPFITPIIKPLLGAKKTAFPFPTDVQGTLRLIKKLIEQGHFKAVIDRTYPFEEIIEAYKYVQLGQKTGNVVISVEHDS